MSMNHEIQRLVVKTLVITLHVVNNQVRTLTSISMVREINLMDQPHAVATLKFTVPVTLLTYCQGLESSGNSSQSTHNFFITIFILISQTEFFVQFHQYFIHT